MKTRRAKRRERWLASLLLLLGVAPAMADETAPRPDSDAVIEARADALLAQMTPAEKAGQLSQYFYLPVLPPQNKLVDEALRDGAVGSLLFVSDPAEANRLQRLAIEHSRLKIPLLFGFDVLHGLRTIFPVPLGMAASWDPALVEAAQAVAAEEASAVGIRWTFAPNVDLSRDPRWGRVVEGAGEDPYLASAIAAAQVRGFQGPAIGSPGRVIAGPKHFAGYGAALGGRDYDEVDLSESALWNEYLPPFKAAIDAGAGNIMGAYMALNGVPASGNAWLLTHVLRDTWGFKGFVSSDSGAVASLVTQGFARDREDAAVRALNAGVDMEMAMLPTPAAFRSLPAALAAGTVKASALDDAVRRILEAKLRLGLFEHPYVDEARVAAVLDDPAHRQLARVAATRSAVLLRNEDDLLPLDRHRLTSIAVIGPLADAERDTLGPWVFAQNRPQAVTVLAGLRAKLGTAVRIDYSEGVRMPARLYPSPFAMLDPPVQRPPLDETAEIRRAAELARASDATVLVLGEAQDMIGESASRSSLRLPGRQQELLDAVIASGKPVVLVVMSARPLELGERLPAAVLDIWYPGSQGGNAVADLLFGDAVPGGKLPFTWIRNAAQAPRPYAHLISHDPAHADQRYWNEPATPTWPFGFGLSYTRFRYSDLKIERARYAPGEPVSVSVLLQNTGARRGDEVAQLYLHQRVGTSARPVRELKGFQRVTLNAGEKRRLVFRLGADDLRYWSSVSGTWLHEQSVFDVWIGGSSDAELAGSFEVRAPDDRR